MNTKSSNIQKQGCSQVYQPFSSFCQGQHLYWAQTEFGMCANMCFSIFRHIQNTKDTQMEVILSPFALCSGTRNHLHPQTSVYHVRDNCGPLIIICAILPTQPASSPSVSNTPDQLSQPSSKFNMKHNHKNVMCYLCEANRHHFSLG